MNRNMLKIAMSSAGFQVNNSADDSIDFLFSRLREQEPLIGIPVILRNDTHVSYLCLTQDYYLISSFRKAGFLRKKIEDLYILHKDSEENRPHGYVRPSTDYDRFHGDNAINKNASFLREHRCNHLIHFYNPTQDTSFWMNAKEEDARGFVNYCKTGRTPNYRPKTFL